MNRCLAAGALGLSVATLLLQPAADPAAAQGGKKAAWLKDYPSARAAAKAAGKPMFLVFR